MGNQLEHDNKNKSSAELALPQLEDFNLRIVRPQILANFFKLKPVMFQMVQSIGRFNGLPSEDTYMHLLNFVTICDSQKQYQLFEEEMNLRSKMKSGCVRWWNQIQVVSIFLKWSGQSLV